MQLTQIQLNLMNNRKRLLLSRQQTAVSCSLLANNQQMLQHQQLQVQQLQTSGHRSQSTQLQAAAARRLLQ
jgi:hypothetical protein